MKSRRLRFPGELSESITQKLLVVNVEILVAEECNTSL